MIYVLFGPPGIGKTYIGNLLSKEKRWSFFDADTIYSSDDALRYLLKEGKYDQGARDRFVEKLMMTVQNLLGQSRGKDLVVAEAFTKEKNRKEFLKYFDNQVTYIMVHASRNLALQRMKARLLKEDHVVDKNVFDFVWDEFETPKIPYKLLENYNRSDKEILKEFNGLIQ